MEDKRIILKPGREKAIKNRHHWIFSGAVLILPNFENGDILPVYSAKGEFLGRGYFNKNSNIIGRMLTFDETPVETALKQNLGKALALRKQFFDTQKTNAYRLINSEGDFLPGLIVDKYADILVLQISTLGMEKLKPLIIEVLQDKLKPKTILERSNMPSRREEGLGDYEALLFGQETKEVKILENGYKFKVDLTDSQKTGFFLDQREMRLLAGHLARDKSVLNCFAYTGAFSVYAAKNDAKSVDTVEISEKALDLAKENLEENNLKPSGKKYNFYQQDVFEFLRQTKSDYDFIILDPPAFAKKKKDIIPACRGYKDINRLALKLLKTPGYLLTSSCSYYVNENLFRKVIFQAALEANKNVRIIQKHVLALDHPINIYQPESEYLKSFLLYVD